MGDDGKPKQLPWEDWREGDDALTSGWMRATAPGGDSDFEGVVSWSGELGYGVRGAEPPQAVSDGRADEGTGAVNDGVAAGGSAHGGHH